MRVRLRVEPAGCVDDHDVAAGRDGVEGDRGWVGAALPADELRSGASCPDLELFLGGGPEGVGGAHGDRAAVLGELAGELADGRRLPGPVHADDQDHGGPVGEIEGRRRAEERGDLLGERLAEVMQAPGASRAARRARRWRARRRPPRGVPPRAAPRRRRRRGRTRRRRAAGRAPAGSAKAIRAVARRSLGARPRSHPVLRRRRESPPSPVRHAPNGSRRGRDQAVVPSRIWSVSRSE